MNYTINSPHPSRVPTLNSAFFFMLRMFGITHVNIENYHLLCKNAKGSRTLYFMKAKNGIAEFTLCREKAWKFSSSEEAHQARQSSGLFFKDMYIEEIINR